MSEANKRTIRVVREEAMRRGKLDKLAGLYTEDYIYHGIPMLGDLRGPTAFRDLIAGFIDAVSGFQETVEDQVAEGDKVVTRISGRGAHTGELMGVAPSGNQLKWTAIVISRFVGGKIAEEWAEFDALSFSRQLGASKVSSEGVTMSPDQRKAQLRHAAAKYFEGLANKNFDLIPYDERVSLRAPLAPGGIHNPLIGRENLRSIWWAPLPSILGQVEVFDYYYNDDLTAVVAEAEVEVTTPKARLRVADRFTVNAAGQIVEQVNHFDPRDVTNPV